MTEELVSYLTRVERKLDDIVLPEVPIDSPLARLGGMILELPGLRGLWPMSAHDATPLIRDYTHNDRHLAFNGNPLLNYYNDLAPTIDFDGVGDFLSYPDNADHDILGTEAYITAAARGVTMGCWTYFDKAVSGAFAVVLGKGPSAAPATASYLLVHSNADRLQAFISNGAAFTVATSASTITHDVWCFTAMRFVPGVSISVWLNGTRTDQLAGVPAAINNSNQPFRVAGDIAGGNLLTGRVSMAFLCAMALTDTALARLYDVGRELFGV